jgi:dephospho-CoA kinase
VGLTGGIGAGKSTVARRLAEHGATIVDADALAREVLAPGTEGLAAVTARFGADVLRPDGSLDRAALARVAFADDDSRRALEAITHPRIADRTAELFAAAAQDAVVVHDVPLLVEKGMAARYQLVVVVDAPVEVRVGRLVRRGMSEADARARIAAQASEAERRAVADVWLDTDRPLAQVEAEVDALWINRLVPLLLENDSRMA